jgi:hypothetical protein
MNQIFLYHIDDYIRVDRAGHLDFLKIKEAIQEIADHTRRYPNHDILLDSRKVHLKDDVHDRMLEILVEVVMALQDYQGKIANMISTDPKRVEFAKKLEIGVQEVGIQYKIFFGHEEAIEWLSDKQVLGLGNGNM